MSEKDFKASLDEATDFVVQQCGGDGRKALAQVLGGLCEQSVDLLNNVKIAAEVCESIGDEPMLPITQDVKDSSNRISILIGVISTLMIRNVLGVSKETANVDIDAFLNSQERGRPN